MLCILYELLSLVYSLKGAHVHEIVYEILTVAHLWSLQNWRGPNVDHCKDRLPPAMKGGSLIISSAASQNNQDF